MPLITCICTGVIIEFCEPVASYLQRMISHMNVYDPNDMFFLALMSFMWWAFISLTLCSLITVLIIHGIKLLKEKKA